MLEALALTKDFGSHRALDTLDLRVEPGEIVCLLGANGAGKTTTINLFLGFLEPTSGEARVDGIDVRSDPVGTKRKLLYVPEQIALFGELTGLENLAYFAALSRVEDRSTGRLRQCLAQAGLTDEAMSRRASVYSKGMRQKVGVALAIAKEARALLLDEPTSGLDPKASAEFHELIVRQRDAGAAVLMVTHDLFRAREAGTRIGLMREGRLRSMIQAADITASQLERLYLDEMSRSAV
jgi:ABC-2 type transport system ATP-binding protein